MIEGFTGLMGSGKTTHAVVRIQEALKQGRKVMCNFYPVVKGMWQFGLWADMMKAENCLCVIDEAQMWFGSREFGRTTQYDLGFFQQSRKEGVDLIWIAQHHARVDVGLREVTSYLWRHKRMGQFFVGVKVEPDDLKTPLGRRIIPMRQSLFELYDSGQRIGGRDGQGYGRGRGRGLASAGASKDRILIVADWTNVILGQVTDTQYWYGDDPDLWEKLIEARTRFEGLDYMIGPKFTRYIDVCGHYELLDEQDESIGDWVARSGQVDAQIVKDADDRDDDGWEPPHIAIKR